MNTVTPPFLIGPESAKQSRAPTADPYASKAQTTALLGRGAEYRRQRIQASDMISTDEAAELTGATRATINAWIKTGRCIGVTHLRRGFRVPKWQFEPYVFPVLLSVAKALGTSDGWQLMSFLETPLDALDGLAPRTALEQGVSAQRIIDLANAEGH
jgi:excisionase family DNA binding protein